MDAREIRTPAFQQTVTSCRWLETRVPLTGSLDDDNESWQQVSSENTDMEARDLMSGNWMFQLHLNILPVIYR